MRLFAALVFSATIVVASGCSSSDDAPAVVAPKLVSFASGTRLRAKVVTGGGAREAVGFHDAQRNEDCTFQLAEDGRTRCLPAMIPLAGSSVFADPACAVPLVPAPGACDAGVKYALMSSYDGSCGATPKEIHALAAAGPARYVLGPSGCALSAGSPAPSSPPLFALGDVVPWTDFVEARKQTVAGSPVSDTILVGVDGARQHLGFRSEALASDCTFEVMPDEVVRCIPQGGSGNVVYTDQACTQPSFVAYSGPCQDVSKRFWRELASPATCRGIRAVYSVGVYAGPADVRPPEQYSRISSSPDECMSLGSNPGSTTDLRSVEADITASLPVTNRVSIGSERLVPALVADGGKPALVPGWHDTERDVDCRFTLASDGKLRCLPTATLSRLFFTDAKCTSPSQVAVLTDTACTGFSGYALVASTTCPITTRVFAIPGPPHDVANASAETAPGRCVSFPTVLKAYDATEVDPTQFVEGASLTE